MTQTRTIRFHVEQDQLDEIFRKYHLAREDLIEAGAVEVFEDGEFFSLKIPDLHRQRKRFFTPKPIHPGRWGQGD